MKKLIPSQLKAGDLIRKKKSKDKIILKFVRFEGEFFVFIELKDGLEYKLRNLQNFERLTP